MILVCALSWSMIAQAGEAPATGTPPAEPAPAAPVAPPGSAAPAPAAPPEIAAPAPAAPPESAAPAPAAPAPAEPDPPDALPAEPEPAPVRAVLPAATPAPVVVPAASLAMWEAEHLERVGATGGDPWGVRRGAEPVSALELATLTGDTAMLATFDRRDRGIRWERRGIGAFGGLCLAMGIAEAFQYAAVAKDDLGAAEDHLWRAGALAAGGTLSFVALRYPARAEEERREHVSRVYSPALADMRIKRHNDDLRIRLGLPAEGVPLVAGDVAVAVPADEPLGAPPGSTPAGTPTADPATAPAPTSGTPAPGDPPAAAPAADPATAPAPSQPAPAAPSQPAPAAPSQPGGGG